MPYDLATGYAMNHPASAPTAETTRHISAVLSLSVLRYMVVLLAVATIRNLAGTGERTCSNEAERLIAGDSLIRIDHLQVNQISIQCVEI